MNALSKSLKCLILLLLLNTGAVYAQVSYDISHKDALKAVLAAKKKAEKLEVLVNIAVVDAGANLKSFIRMDESFLGSIDVAIKKAKTSRYFDTATGDLGKLTQPGGIIYNIEHSNNGLVTFPGGVPIKNANGKVIGAIGVSGGTIEQDHEIALAGANAISRNIESLKEKDSKSTRNNTVTTDELMPYMQDFKSISANNTVTVTSYEKGGSHYVYVGGFKGVDVFSLDKDGKLTLVSTQELYKVEGPARGMVVDQINGTDFLFVANKHGNAIETFKILDNGSLKRVSLTMDTDETHLGTAITLQVVHMNQASYLFIGGLEETPGLSSFKIEDDGKLTHVQSMKDDEKIFTDGIIGMFTHKIEDNTYLYTGGFQDNGVSSFKVHENGTFKNINNISDNTTDRYLTGAYPVTGVKLGDNYYIIVGHRHHKYYKRNGFIKNPDFFYHGDGVSVFKVDKKGALAPHFVLKDDENTKLQGQTRIEIVSVNDHEAVLAVGTRDDASIQLCKLDVNGMLSPINYLETGFSIYYGLRSHKIGDSNFLIAGSNRFDLKKVATYKILPKIDRSGKVLRHIVNLKYKEEATEAQIDEAVQIFLDLKNEIPEIEHIEWGVNDSKEGASKGLTHCFTLTFKDDHGREVYLFHEAHIALVNKIGPIIGDVLVMDYWTEE